MNDRFVFWVVVGMGMGTAFGLIANRVATGTVWGIAAGTALALALEGPHVPWHWPGRHP